MCFLSKHVIFRYNNFAFCGCIEEDNMTQYSVKIHTWKYGLIIHDKRISCGFTEEKLAELCDISDREVRNIESGHSIPKLDTALKLAYALNMNVGDFAMLIEVGAPLYV